MPLAAILLAAATAWYSGLTGYLSLESIAHHRGMLMAEVAERYGVALAIYGFVYVAVVALSLPGGVFLTILGGFLFGWLVAGFATVFFATVGATLLFLIARTAVGETLAARAGPFIEKLRAGFQEDAISYLLFLRLVPVFPFWAVNLAPALLGMRLVPYSAATFVGIIPGTFAFAFAGAGLDSIIEAQERSYRDCLAQTVAGTSQNPCTFTLDPGSLLTREIITAFVALGIVALIPVVLKRIKAKKNT